MASIGKKILSAFIDIEPRSDDPAGNGSAIPAGNSRDTTDAPVPTAASNHQGQTAAAPPGRPAATDPRFTDYFDKLFSEANIPGPDYYEFSKMIEAMQSIPSEQSRFYAAYAGLQVQGLDKEKLLSTAGEYLRILTADADHFHSTVDAALQEKVHSRTAQAEEKGQRIRALSEEIVSLQQQIAALQTEIADNSNKIQSSSSGYSAESERRKARIAADIEKIKHYIH
jgi:hypothetical protein